MIDGWLRDDLDAPRKQRHTAKRIFDRLLDEREANCPRHETPGQRQYLKIKVEITAAIVDRLTFGGTILETGTDSYRLAHATKQLTG